MVLDMLYVAQTTLLTLEASLLASIHNNTDLKRKPAAFL
jgi:hypothetical protein